MAIATQLSVNLNKVALLRNQRDVGYPSVTEMAERVIAAGARGITVHPRPDERHKAYWPLVIGKKRSRLFVTS